MEDKLLQKINNVITESNKFLKFIQQMINTPTQCTTIFIDNCNVLPKVKLEERLTQRKPKMDRSMYI